MDIGTAMGAGWSSGISVYGVVAEAPRLAPHREPMEAALSGAVGAPVTVKATTAEGLGAIGRGEGIAAQAVALLAAR